MATDHDIDPAFAALPLRALADAALQRARDLGATHADVRVERHRSSALALHDGRLETSVDGASVGMSVRVVAHGSWGFAGGVELTTDAAARLATDAVELARVTAPTNSEPVELAPEPPHGEQTWVSTYEIDPFDVPETDRIALLADWSHRLLDAEGVDHVDTSCYAVRECKFYADLADTVTMQQRVRLEPEVSATTVDRDSGRFETMASAAPPVGRGWEYLTGTGWDWDDELARLPGLVTEKLRAPSVQPGRYDLVIDPTNLWLTIHESVGHATELDRALGYEANYAGTSFATPDQLGTLQYGSPLMHVTGDRIAPHGLASVAYDDEGVEAQRWDIVRDGVLVGYQLDRRTAALSGIARSNGCAYADAPQHMPIQRMANVSLQPAPDGPSTDELVAAVEDGIYIVGDRSWSIDMQRYNFQFTGKRFYRIRAGRLAGQLRDVAYQATTTDFWRSLTAVGGPQTYLLGGALNCGKGQPGQVAPVSHGCPAAVFRGVRILNTVQEAGR